MRAKIISLRHWWFFTVLLVYGLVQAASLGISDDEAYYWVLSRTPAWGYVYHPPLVAWIISVAEKMLGWAPLPRELLVRLPGLFLFLGSIALARRWLMETASRDLSIRQTHYGLMVVPGFAALSWMMVPDHPLIFSWMLGFYSCWRIIQSDELRAKDLSFLAISAALGILSKFSAVLFCASAALSILFLSRKKIEPFFALGAGAVVGTLPIIYWNSQNEWAALLYQFQSRHAGASLDFLRYGKFWATQLIFAGPALMLFGFSFLGRAARRWKSLSLPEQYLFFWFLPALVFWVQPAFSSFKPHWAIVAWIPLGLAAALGETKNPAFARLHAAFLIPLLVFVGLFTQFPISSAIQSWWTGKPANPLYDLSNDLKGWDELPRFLKEKNISQDTPVVGARYQTASQAAFSLWPHRVVTLTPKTLAESREWPSLEQALLERGAGLWPRLQNPVIYIHDDRFDQEPSFSESKCSKLGVVGQPRYGMPSKRIHIWDCQPDRP